MCSHSSLKTQKYDITTGGPSTTVEESADRDNVVDCPTEERAGYPAVTVCDEFETSQKKQFGIELQVCIDETTGIKVCEIC